MSNESFDVFNQRTSTQFGYTKLMNDRRINELCKNDPIYILQQVDEAIDRKDKLYYSTMNKWQIISVMCDLFNWHSVDHFYELINQATTGETAYFDCNHCKYSIVVKQNIPMIINHSPTQVTAIDGKKVISFGTSSYGYDIRVDNKFKRFKKPVFSTDTLPIDPKSINLALMEEWTYDGDSITIEPNSFVLANTVESFNIPPNVLVNCIGKSTYARCGIICIVTPLEPGWSGYLTLEFANTTNRPVKLYIGEGVAQLEFYESLHLPQTTYADRGGKYQNQDREPIIPRLK